MARKPAGLADKLDSLVPADATPVNETPADEAQANEREMLGRKPSRTGTVLIGAHLSVKFLKPLKQLALDTDKTQRDLLEEAIIMLLNSRGITPPKVEKAKRRGRQPASSVDTTTP